VITDDYMRRSHNLFDVAIPHSGEVVRGVKPDELRMQYVRYPGTVYQGSVVEVRGRGSSGWHRGRVRVMSPDGNYDIQLDGGELLESVIPQHVRLIQKTGPPTGRGNAEDAADRRADPPLSGVIRGWSDIFQNPLNASSSSSSSSVRESVQRLSQSRKRVVEEESTIEEGGERVTSKKKPRALNEEAARLVAEFGRETIRLTGGGRLVSVHPDFEADVVDSDDEDSLYSWQSIGDHSFSSEMSSASSSDSES